MAKNAVKSDAVMTGILVTRFKKGQIALRTVAPPEPTNPATLTRAAAGPR